MSYQVRTMYHVPLWAIAAGLLLAAVVLVAWRVRRRGNGGAP